VNYITIGQAAARPVLRHIEPRTVPLRLDDESERLYRDSLPWYLPPNIDVVWNARQDLGYYPYEIPLMHDTEESSLERLQKLLNSTTGIMSLAFLLCTEPMLAQKKWFRVNKSDLLDKFVKIVRSRKNRNEAEARTAVEAIFRLDQALGPLYSRQSHALPYDLLRHLPNNQYGQALALHIILLIALAATEDTSRDHARRWAAKVRKYSRECWHEEPLKYTAKVLSQTLYIGRSLGVISANPGSTSDSLFRSSYELLTFFGRHNLREHVEDPINGIIERATGHKKSTMEQKEALSLLSDKIYGLTSVAEELSYFGPNIHHLLIPNQHGAKRDAINALCEFQHAIFEVSEATGIDQDCLNLRKYWNNCRDSVVEFIEWLFPDAYDCIAESRNRWIDSHKGVPLRVELDVTAFKKNTRVFLPSQLVKHFIKICLDNTVTRAYPDQKSWKDAQVRIILEKHKTNDIVIVSVQDAGCLFMADIKSEDERHNRINEGSLGQLIRDITPFDASISLPEANAQPKLFGLVMHAINHAPSFD